MTDHGRRGPAIAIAATLLALLALAFAKNWSIVHDLSAPGLDIQFRELAAAQTVLDEGYGPDATYLHEHVWYNPMAAWLAAGVSRVSAAALPVVIARSGPFVNLAAPLALFLLVAVTVDALAATAALAAFVFMVGTGLPFYYAATYSPWFSPENFGQAFLYVLLALVYRAFRPAAALGWAVAAGAALGLTFLVHTAPAIAGGLVIVGFAIVEARTGDGAATAATRVAVALAVAFLVSLPFSFEILWHYHLKIVNPFPSSSPSDLLDLNELPGLAWRLTTLPALVAVAAFAMRARAGLDRGMRLLLVWLGVVAAALSVHLGAVVLEKLHIAVPAIVPPFHFFFYLMAIVAIGFGIGVRDAAHWLVRRAESSRRLDSTQTHGWRTALVCGATVLSVAAGFRQYAGREDFTGVRREAALMNASYSPDVVAWIRAHTSPADVFLCADDASMYVVTPAGRKVVATNRYFSNPYVDWAAREADRGRMFRALEQQDVERFAEIALSYGVRFVVLSLDRREEWLHMAGLRARDLPALDEARLAALPGFTPALRSERFAIVRFDGESRASR